VVVSYRQKRVTGSTILYLLTGTGAQITTKILAERRAGRFPKDDVLPQHKLIEGCKYFDGTRPVFEDIGSAFKIAAQAMEAR